jgi:peptide/nickel transport system permease protein
VLGVTVLVFVMINLAPGDPIAAMVPPEMGLSGPALDAYRESLGLDKPLPVRYAIWLGELAHGNLGYSYLSHRPVGRILLERLWPTLELTTTALAISIVLGVSLGIVSAVKQYSWLDYLLTLLSFVGVSTPGFFAAMGALYVFALKVGWFPTSGMVTPGADLGPLDNLHHLALPAIVLGLERTAALVRYTRSSMLEVIRQDYITTARAKGVRERVVIGVHAFRNALIPLITVVGLSLPFLFSGAVFIEVIFSWPGMGSLAVNAISQRDYPVLMGFNLVAATIVLLANLLADLAYSFADPRIRYA